MDEKEYSVSEAVRLIGVESHVLRYWEEELQVEIRRTAQGHRVYSEGNIETFRRVRDLKERGLQLKAIRVLLDGAEGDLTRSTLEEQICGFGNPQENQEELVSVSENPQEDRKERDIGPEKNQEQAAYDDKTISENGHAGEPPEVCAPYHTALSGLEDQNPDHMHQFEEILKSLIREVIEEQNQKQNQKQEQLLREILREEIRQMHFSYEEMLQDVMREAAAERESVREPRGFLGWIRRFLQNHSI